MNLETKCIHAGVDKNLQGTCSTPIYQASAYRFQGTEQAEKRFALEEGGPIYSRIGNPTVDVFEQRIGALEGGPALATSSGASAVLYAILNLARSGDHIVAAQNVYGGTYDLLKYTLANMGIECTFVSLDYVKNFEDAIRSNTKAIIVETMANPNSDICDIRAVVKVGNFYNIPVIVDNTFATPVLCRPIEYGAAVVVHSATKFICGNGSTMGGVIVENPSYDWSKTYLNTSDPSYHGCNFYETFKGCAFTTRARAVILRDTGACLSPFNAWMLLNGLETLPLRVRQHVKNALEVVEFLKNHPKVKAVHHPSIEQFSLYTYYFGVNTGAGSIFTIEVDADKKGTLEFIDRLKMFYCLANVGDAKCLVTHPRTTTHSQLSDEEAAEQRIYDNTVRLSIGIENVNDIIADLEQAFA